MPLVIEQNLLAISRGELSLHEADRRESCQTTMNPSAGRPPRCRFQFSLRAMFIVIAVVVAPAAWIAKERRQSAYEMERTYEMSIAYMRQTPLGYGSVAARQSGGPYDSWELATRGRPQGWCRDLARIVLGRRILVFDAQNVTIDDDDLKSIAALPNLQSLRFDNVQIKDVELLAGLKSLRELSLTATNVSDLTPIARLTNLRNLTIVSPVISDVTPLAALTQLQELWLEAPMVHDLSPLDGLLSLERLGLDGTPVSREEFERLQTSLPNCKIHHDPFR